MARADNIAIAQDLLTRLGTNAPPDSVLELFADDVPGMFQATRLPFRGSDARPDASRFCRS